MLIFIQSRSSGGGPTIMDINSGYVKDANALINLHQPGPNHVTFRKIQYNTYREIVERIRNRIMEEFELNTLYFSGFCFLCNFFFPPFESV